MLRTTALLAGLALAAPLACGGSSDSDDARDLALASISSRIDNTNQRLEALQTRVEETAAKVETIAEWTVDRPEPEPEPVAVREPIARPRTPPPTRLSPDLKDPFAPSVESDTDGEAKPCPRCIEGAEEAIECTESGTCEIECTVDRAFAKELEADPGLFAKQARVVPSTSGGYKLYGIRRGSLPKLLQLKNGDALTEIDGKAIAGFTELADALTRFAGGKTKKLDFTLVRKGKPCELVLKAN